MPPAVASVSNTTYASRTNTTVTAPSGITNGDILLGVLFTGATTTAPTATPPSGFTAVTGSPLVILDGNGFQGRFAVWAKTASGESGSYQFTHTSCSSQGVVIRISGANASATILTATRAYAGGGDSVSTSIASSVTTAVDGSLVLIIGQDWADTSNNLSPPSGTTPTFSEHLDVTLTHVFSGVLATAGATGNKSWTNNVNASQSRWQTYMLAIEPAAGAPIPLAPIMPPMAPAVARR